MKNKNSNLFPLLTGLLAGASAIYFLKSEKGQQFVDLALRKGDTIKSAILENTQDLVESGKEKLNNAMESGKENLVDIAVSAQDHAQDKISELERGINNAKKRISKA